MKVLLINPCRSYPPRSRKPTLGLPLGLLSIAAVIEREGFEVSVFDTLVTKRSRFLTIDGVLRHGVDDKEFANTLLKEAPDIVGIGTLFTSQIGGLVDAVRITRRCLPSSVIVVGGPHFSIEADSFLSTHPEIDYIVSGEGEQPMLELAKALSVGKTTDNIMGLTYRNQGENKTEKISTNPTQAIEELDSLPIPAYDKIDMNLFFELQNKGLRTRPYRNNRAVSIITSRGCPYDCIFCSVHLHMGKPIRTHSVEYVINHIDHLVSEYKVGHLEFEDDNLTFYKRRTETLFRALANRSYKISWNTPNGVRFDTLNRTLLEAMKDSGCNGLVVAPESGDQETITKIVKKAIRLDKMIPVSRWCQELSIPLSSFYLIGFPGETKEKIRNTLEFALRMYKDYDVIPMLSFAMPLLGTELHDIVSDQGLATKQLTPRNLASARNVGLIQTKEFTPAELQQFRREFLVKVYRVNFRKNIRRLASVTFVVRFITKHGIIGTVKIILSRAKKILASTKSPDYGKEMEIG